MVFTKMSEKWKSVKKGFSMINKSKNGQIAPEELKHALDQWGIILDESQLQMLYKTMDRDGDGIINYEDFKETVGHYIQPREQLYFRQERKKVKVKRHIYQEESCW